MYFYANYVIDKPYYGLFHLELKRFLECFFQKLHVKICNMAIADFEK